MSEFQSRSSVVLKLCAVPLASRVCVSAVSRDSLATYICYGTDTEDIHHDTSMIGRLAV